MGPARPVARVGAVGKSTSKDLTGTPLWRSAIGIFRSYRRRLLAQTLRGFDDYLWWALSSSKFSRTGQTEQ